MVVIDMSSVIVRELKTKWSDVLKRYSLETECIKVKSKDGIGFILYDYILRDNQKVCRYRDYGNLDGPLHDHKRIDFFEVNESDLEFFKTIAEELEVNGFKVTIKVK